MRVTTAELKHYFDIEATFHPGFTGLGGDVELTYDRVDVTKDSVSLITCHELPPTARFSEGATCPRAPRNHRCLPNNDNVFTDDGDYWLHVADYPVGAQGRHACVSHVSLLDGAGKRFEAVATMSAHDGWTKDITVRAELDFDAR